MTMAATHHPSNSTKSSTKSKSTSSRPPQCTGNASLALKLFQERVKELKLVGQAKPDMVAFKELQARYTPERTHGILDNVPIGLRLNGRGEAAIVGIHRRILSGIDAIKDEACYGVCLSGGYADDHDDDNNGNNNGNNNGTVIYTGSGGQKGKRQVKDQEENADNKSLIRSCDSGIPIRMLRLVGKGNGSCPVYEYVGLYTCADYTYAPSADGPLVFQFTLTPLVGSWKRPSSSIPVAHGTTRSSSRNGGTNHHHHHGGTRDRLMGRIEQNTNSSRNLASSRRQRMGASTASSQLVKDIQRSLSKYLPADSLVSVESVEHCHDLLKHLNTIDMTLALLTDSLIGKVVTKFKHHPEVGPTAKALVTQWKQIAGAAASTKSTEAASKQKPAANHHSAAELPPQRNRNEYGSSTSTTQTRDDEGSTTRPIEPNSKPAPAPAPAATKLATDTTSRPMENATTNNPMMVQAKPPPPPNTTNNGGKQRRGFSIAQLCSSIEGRAANDRH